MKIAVGGSRSFNGLRLFSKESNNVKKVVKEIIAFRKACKASGTGLSHYILMDGKTKK